jgi:hypothetical protein
VDRNGFVMITFLIASATMNCASAQQAGEDTLTWTPRVIALAPPKTDAPTMTVSSPDFAGQNYRDKRFFNIECCGGQNLSPGVAWSAGPAGTQSYVLVMEGQGGVRIPH